MFGMFIAIPIILIKLNATNLRVFHFVFWKWVVLDEELKHQNMGFKQTFRSRNVTHTPGMQMWPVRPINTDKIS